VAQARLAAVALIGADLGDELAVAELFYPVLIWRREGYAQRVVSSVR
jgi:hypothetical protein